MTILHHLKFSVILFDQKINLQDCTYLFEAKVYIRQKSTTFTGCLLLLNIPILIYVRNQCESSASKVRSKAFDTYKYASISVPGPLRGWKGRENKRRGAAASRPGQGASSERVAIITVIFEIFPMRTGIVVWRTACNLHNQIYLAN